MCHREIKEIREKNKLTGRSKDQKNRPKNFSDLLIF